MPNALAPRTGNNSKTLCCLCCESGPISAQFHIDRTGYVPGEFITLNGEVTNRSNRTMENSRVELRMVSLHVQPLASPGRINWWSYILQRTVFHATTKSKTQSKVVGTIKKEEIEPGGTAVWSGETFLIPPLPPSQLINCRIIDISYAIVVSPLVFISSKRRTAAPSWILLSSTIPDYLHQNNLLWSFSFAAGCGSQRPSPWPWSAFGGVHRHGAFAKHLLFFYQLLSSPSRSFCSCKPLWKWWQQRYHNGPYAISSSANKHWSSWVIVQHYEY